jgi:ParB family chromosome partitioning protein
MPRPRKSNPPTNERTKLRNVALFKDEDEPTVQASPQTLPIDRIVTSSSQPRRYFDPEKLEQLTQSVKEHGILEPLLVRSLPDNKYELVAGERRYRAAAAAGLNEVPVVIKELTDSEALQLALIENLQREDLNPVEETEGILQLLALKLESDRDGVISILNQLAKAQRGLADNVVRQEDQQVIEQVFQGIGRITSESFRTHRLPLLNLPEDILEALRSGQIEYTKAKAIASVKDEAAREELLKDAIANSLSLSQIKEKVSDVKPVREKEELRSRFDTTYSIAKKSKQLWQDPKKRKKLESLLAQLEKLIGEESHNVVNKATLDPIFEEPESTEQESTETGEDEKELTDQELAEVLGVSNLVIRDFRVKGKNPPAALAKKLLEWEVKGEGWVKKT